MRKSVFRVSDQSNTNRAVQAKKMARGLKVQNYEVEGLYYMYQCRENKGDDQLCADDDQLCGHRSSAVTVQLICAFVLAYAKNRFSHDAADINKSTYIT